MIANLTSQEGVVMAKTYETQRKALKRKDRHAPSKPVTGVVQQINTLNQFHSTFQPMISKYKFPSAACGAFSIANSILLAKLLSERRKKAKGVDKAMSAEELKAIVAVLRSPAKVTPLVERVMKEISEERAKYVAKHKKTAFTSKKAEDKYMQDWVANYEISDWFIKFSSSSLKKEGVDTATDADTGDACNAVDMTNVHFLRYNQWPERNGSTFEEKERLVEEKVFGGEKTGDKVKVELEEGASRFIVESFVPERKLRRPEEWLAMKSEGKGKEGAKSPAEARSHLSEVFLLDVNGHFVTSFSCHLEKKDKSITPCLVVINTTGASYISPGAPAAAYDLSFISPAPANPFAEGVEQIKAMGIQKTDQEISRALLSAGGDISTAVAILLS
mmetsp:Transcript_4261/g.5672  ORF Transcript_4261/g.5672 Transcript_4261/m.5672 type:complete len:389 (+) Transcript_4261:131-1297(+)